jgi:hypothetical protein
MVGAPPGQQNITTSSPFAAALEPRIMGGKMLLGAEPLTVIATLAILILLSFYIFSL